MKFLIAISVVAVSICIEFSQAGEVSCDNFPKTELSKCCKVPEINDDQIIMKLMEKHAKDSKLDFTGTCKMSEEYCKEIKVIKGDGIDVDATVKYLEQFLKDDDWKTIAKSIIPECNDIVTKKKEEIVSVLEKDPFNVKKGECNPFYMTFMMCAHVKAFENCPKQFWTDKPECTESKEFFKECASKAETWSKLATGI